MNMHDKNKRENFYCLKSLVNEFFKSNLKKEMKCGFFGKFNDGNAKN